MGKVVKFTGLTKLDIPANDVLENAIDELDGVVLMGYDKDGYETFKSSIADGAEILWLLKRFEKKLMGIPDDDGL